MLILLPPSEGKSRPSRGRSVRPEEWGEPLASARTHVIEALSRLCAGSIEEASRVLGVGAGQADEIERNARLLEQPTAAAERVYTGVLYDALGLTKLDASAHRRALARIGIVSSVYGVVRPGERVAPYRLSGAVSLPGLGPVAGHWRRVLDPVLRERAGGGLVVDLRSTTYAGFWRPAPDLVRRVATVRVLHESAGRRTVVSHFNKATKGRLVRDLLESGADPRTPAALARAWTDLGWHVESGPPTGSGTPLDVVVTEV